MKKGKKMTNLYLSEAVNMQFLTTFRTRRQRRREAANKVIVLSVFVVIALSYLFA
tara:strand:+ start:51 stop:215 length:165 start_codon:yes stop_codon:yes gene_type:complete